MICYIRVNHHPSFLLQGKNPLSVISDEDMITLQSVLSSEEGKKILQETSLPGIENRNDSMQEIANDSKNEDKSVVGVTEPEVNIQLELDDETTSQILKVRCYFSLITVIHELRVYANLYICLVFTYRKESRKVYLLTS